MKMKTTIVLHDVYCDVTYPEYLHVRNQYYKNPTSFKCLKIIVFQHLFIKLKKNAIAQRHPEDWSWKFFYSQQTLSLNTIFAYGKEYRDWT